MGGEIATGRMKIAGLTPFQIFPAHFGGAERCFNVLTGLGVDVVLGLSWEGRWEKHQFGATAYELIPVEPAAVQKAQKLQAHGFVTYDTMPTLCINEIKRYRERLAEEAPDLIVLEHPWLVKYIPDEIPFIYDSHNAETHHFGQRFGTGSPEYLNVKALEKEAVERATLITYCSEADMDTMREMFHVTAPVLHLPNGVAPADRTGRKRNKNLLFVGSVYQPNVDAAQRLANLATLLPEFTIQIAGPCAYYVQTSAPNVQLLGPVTDETLHTLFLEAYAFVNLVTEGSGTHLKLARALSYGLPILTTPIGARGYNTVTITTGDDLLNKFNEIAANYDEIETAGLAEATQLSWDTILTPLRDTLASLQ